MSQQSRYGAIARTFPFTTGKTFFLVGSSDTILGNFLGEFPADKDGVVRTYTTATAALAACVAGRGDYIYTAPSFSTALTATELLAAETKGVTILPTGLNQNGAYYAHRATAALPATTQSALFTVTGRIKLLSIIGEVTTIVQTQACNTKIVANPTVGNDVDMCAVLDITAAAVGAQFSITGTLATAMVKTTSGAGVFQAAPLLVLPGTIDLSTAATNTGSVKWRIEYTPVDPGARVFAA